MKKNIFGLSFLLALGLCGTSGMSAFAYQLDAANHVISVTPSSTADATTTDLKSVFSYLTSRKDQATTWTVNLAPGKYPLTKQINVQNLQNVNFVSNISKPAQIVKDASWNATTGGEFLLHFTFGKKLCFTGMQFYGNTTYANNVDPVWPDQGVYFGSCNGIDIKNNGFFNFGNAALRVATYERDPVPGVNSFNTTVANNLFNNIYQISTTTTDQTHGGTVNYLLQNNVFYNLRGSIKFASRTAGAKDIRIIGNKVNGGDHYGLEINNYDNMEIRGNTLQNLKEFAINIYNNPRAPQSFPWGNNFTIADNVISNVGQGIRFSSEPYANGYTYKPSNLVINNNAFMGVSGLTNGAPAISQVNGSVNGLTITNNKLSNIGAKKYVGYTSTCTNVTNANNLVDGVLLQLLK